LDFTDQPSHPAILSDGRIVLAWVDRFQTKSIRIRMASSIDQTFEENTELILHREEISNSINENTGELLGEMNLWNFGLTFCEVLPDGNVIVLYYAGSGKSININWAKISLD